MVSGVTTTAPPTEPGPGKVDRLDCMVAIDGTGYDDVILGIKLREKNQTVTDKTWVCTAFVYNATFVRTI